METSWELLELACFFDLNKVYLPTYLLTYLTFIVRMQISIFKADIFHSFDSSEAV